MARPQGPGIYGEIFLPANTRRELTRTQKDHDFLPAMPDARPTLSATFADVLVTRAARNFGGTPTEAVRKLLDAEMAKHAGQK
jgi:hypothetical protein